MRIDLNGTWRLKRCQTTDSHEEVFGEAFLPEGWLEAPVPGDVRTALKARGLIDGDYLGKDLQQERWIDESDWLYYCRFALPEGEGVPYLELEGVDTLAEVWLNGHLLGKCENMFLPYAFPIPAAWRKKDNALLIRIRSTVHVLEGIDRTGLYPQEDTNRLLLRKSQMNFGWDFCGHCLTHGLWKGVSIRFRKDAELDAPYLRTVEIKDGAALLALSTEFSWPKEPGKLENMTITLRLMAGDELCLEQTWPAQTAQGVECWLPGARLWWPRPYGKPFLYQAQVQLHRGTTLLDTRSFRFGIRTVELLQDPLPEGGRSFTLRVNGRPLFIRGANWVPLRAVYGEIQPGEERFFLQRALDANLTMLRIWGGGIYESEGFFDFCDENGLLIMQDFMLACGILPQGEKFLAQVAEEVAWVVRHYRNRPSIGIWSADNELDEAYRWYDLLPQFPTNRVNRVAVRQAVAQQDPFRPFLVSSPCSPFDQEEGGDDPNSPLQGDMHVYLTRFHKESPYYYKKLLEFVPRFMSEYGFSSLPCRDSYEKFNFFRKPLDMQANPWLGELPAFQHLNDANDVPGMIYFTQYSHARGLQYWIEYMRSHKGVCGGTLYWKFNDPIAPNRENMLFPSLMSVIDFYGMPKLAFDYARRAYEDVILAFREQDGHVQVYGCNETQQSHQGTLTMWWIDSQDRREQVLSCQVMLGADAATLLADWVPEEHQRQPRNGYLKAELCGTIYMQNRFFPGDLGDYIGYVPPKAQLQCRMTACTETGMMVELQANHFVQDVCITVLNRHARCSDNAFDMDAGEVRTVTVALPMEERRECPLRIQALNAEPILLAWPV